MTSLAVRSTWIEVLYQYKDVILLCQTKQDEGLE